MHDTRQSLADKLSALEASVTQTVRAAQQTAQQTFAEVRGTVQETLGAVQGTVDSVKGGVQGLLGGGSTMSGDAQGAAANAVHGLVGNASDQIKQGISDAGDQLREAFDVKPLVDKNPYGAVGVAVGVGFVAGLLFAPGKGGHSAGGSAFQGLVGGASAGGRPGVFDEVFKLVGTKIREVSENAINQLASQVQQSVQQSVPKLIDGTINRFTDNLQQQQAAGTADMGHS